MSRYKKKKRKKRKSKNICHKFKIFYKIYMLVTPQPSAFSPDRLSKLAERIKDYVIKKKYIKQFQLGSIIYREENDFNKFWTALSRGCSTPTEYLLVLEQAETELEESGQPREIEAAKKIENLRVDLANRLGINPIGEIINYKEV